MLVLNYIITFLELQKVEKIELDYLIPHSRLFIMALAKPVP
jgi:hypothetical protein